MPKFPILTFHHLAGRPFTIHPVHPYQHDHHHHHPPPPLIPLSSYPNKKPSPVPTTISGPTKIIYSQAQAGGTWVCLNYRGDRVTTMVTRGLTHTKRHIVKQAYPLLAHTKEKELGLYLTSPSPTNPSKTLLLDDERWNNLVLCQQVNHLPSIMVVTPKDLEVFTSQQKGKEGDGVKKARIRDDPIPHIIEPTSVSSSSSITITPGVPPTQPILTERLIEENETETQEEEVQPDRALETTRPIENDPFETKEEALKALREIGPWVEKASLPSIDLGTMEVTSVVHVDPLVTNRLEPVNNSTHHHPSPSLQSEHMVVEIVDLTDQASPVSNQRPTSVDTVEGNIHLVDLKAQVVVQAPTAGPTSVKMNTRVQLKPRTSSHMTDRPRHYSARAMTKNERRLHESLRAKFDGRGIPSRTAGSD